MTIVWLRVVVGPPQPDAARSQWMTPHLKRLRSIPDCRGYTSGPWGLAEAVAHPSEKAGIVSDLRLLEASSEPRGRGSESRIERLG
jgi:hypothetical protein